MKALLWIGRIGVSLLVIAGILMTFYYHAPYRYFAFSIAILTGYLIFEFALKKYLYARPLAAKQEVSLAELATVWKNQEELEKLKKELEELKETLEKKRLEENPIVQKYFGKIDEEEAEKLAQLGEAITIEKVVDSVKQSKENKEVKIIVANEKEDTSQPSRATPQANTDSTTEEKDGKLIETFISIFPNERAEAQTMVLNLSKEEIKKAIEIYEKIKELKPSLPCIIGALKGENECRVAYEAKKLQEKGVNPRKFLDFVSELVNQEVNLEVDGKIYKYVALSHGNCVYINPILLQRFFKEYSPDKEKLFAFLFKDYLCPTIDWRKGFIKRGFRLKFDQKEFRVPFIAVKKESFDTEFTDLEGVKITT